MAGSQAGLLGSKAGLAGPGPIGYIFVPLWLYFRRVTIFVPVGIERAFLFVLVLVGGHTI